MSVDGHGFDKLRAYQHFSSQKLQDLLDQLPGSQHDARPRLEEVVASDEAVGHSLDELARQQGVRDTVS